MKKSDELMQSNPILMDKIKQAQKEAKEDNLLSLEEAKEFLIQNFKNKRSKDKKYQS